jgi:hypothetical protein
MANLSWARNAVFEAAVREIEYEARHKPGIAPTNPQQTGAVFQGTSPPMRSIDREAA